MAVTRSRAAERVELKSTRGGLKQPRSWRLTELLWMAGAGLLVALGLYFVFQSKAPELAQGESDLASKKLLNLNDLGAREDLLPALAMMPNQKDREEVARKIYYLSGGLPNVGAIRGAVTGEQFRALKPQFVVRRPDQFRASFRLWVALFFVAFLGAHVWLSLRRSRDDQSF